MWDEEKTRKKVYTVRQGKLKAENYCAYQERAQQEVRDKLYEWGLHQDEVEGIIADLISEDFINEERFSKSYAVGKFRMKGWGKVKIRRHLKLKRISEPLIKIALAEIDLEEYTNRLEEIILKKKQEYSVELTYAEKAKLIRFLQMRGFENDLIFSILN